MLTWKENADNVLIAQAQRVSDGTEHAEWEGLRVFDPTTNGTTVYPNLISKTTHSQSASCDPLSEQFLVHKCGPLR